MSWQPWVFDGATWTQVAGGPQARLGSAMASLGNEVVLFGGTAAYRVDAGTLLGEPQSLNDTWTFDGTAWTQVTPGEVPPARTGHAMATVF